MRVCRRCVRESWHIQSSARAFESPTSASLTEPYPSGNKTRKITLVDRKKGKQEGEYNLAEVAVGGKVDIVVNNEVAQDGRTRSPHLGKYAHARWT